MIVDSHPTVRRAFTLVEVLVATIVLGLGVLGLSALFAGAATQQQTAASVSRAVAYSQSAIGVAGSRIGAIVNLSVSGATTGPTPGTWYALTSDQDFGVLRSSFFPNVPGEYGFETTSRGKGFFLSGLSTPTADVGVLRLDHGRVLPNENFSVSLRDSAKSFGDPPSVQYLIADPPTSDLSADGAALVDYLNGVGEPPDVVTLWRDGMVTVGAAIPGDRLTLRTGFGGLAGDLAEISGTATVPAVDITVVVGEYDWVNDTVASVGDRVLTTPSDLVPGGRRPVMAYSILYREQAAGRETAIFTYSLRPVSTVRNRPDEQPFIPPDTRQDFDREESVLREVEVELGLDESTGDYYVVPVNDDDAWVATPGQILLMSSRIGAQNADPADPPRDRRGADTPVRVLTVRVVNDERRAILEDSPRIGFVSPVEFVDQTETIWVWALAPIIRSRSSDGTEWQVTPVEAVTDKLGF